MNIFRIGVTGHRALPHFDSTALDVRKAVKDLRVRLSPGDGKESGLVVFSPLAEGADRLVVKEVLKDKAATLEAVLPFEVDDYRMDFRSSESRAEFDGLFAAARSVHVMPPAPSRREAYAAAGQFVVDNSDIIIALWDGKEPNGSGGTADTVMYARSKGKRIIRIDTERPGRVLMEG